MHSTREVLLRVKQEDLTLMLAGIRVFLEALKDAPPARSDQAHEAGPRLVAEDGRAPTDEAEVA